MNPEFGNRGSMPKVSVVVCTFNQRDFLPFALDSILNQKTDFAFEIIIADDASTDGTRDVCLRYKSLWPDRIRLILNERNKGVVDNYFDAILAAQGEYIADLAGDDVWTDCEKISRQVRILDNDPEIVLTHAAWRYMHPDGSLAAPKGFARPANPYSIQGSNLINAILAHRKEEFFIHLCTALYRRDTVVGLLADCPTLLRGKWPCEDLQLEALLASKGKIAYEPTEVLAYRVGHPSISSIEDEAKNAAFAIGALRLTAELARHLGKDSPELRDYYRKDFRYAAMNAFRSGDRRLARQLKELAGEERWKITDPVALAAIVLMKHEPLWKTSRSIWKRIKSRSRGFR